MGDAVQALVAEAAVDPVADVAEFHDLGDEPLDRRRGRSPAELPGVNLRVLEGSSGQVEEWLTDSRVDIAILYRYTATLPEGEEALATVDSYLIGHRGDRVTANGQVSFASLDGLPFILPGAPNGLRTALDAGARQARITLAPVIEADSLPLQKQLTAQEHLYTVLPLHAVWQEVQAGTLQAARIVEPPFQRTVALAFAKASRPNILEAVYVGTDVAHQRDQVRWFGGMVGNRMGAILIHLAGEWAAADKPPKLVDADIVALAELLPRLNAKGKLDMKKARAIGIAGRARGMREASLAAGASKWQTIRDILLPASAPGILTGVILAMARGAGEVAPLMLVGVVKLAPSLPIDGLAPFLHLDRKFMHLGFHIFDLGFQSPDSDAARPMVFATTLLLIVLVVCLNLGAITIRNRLRARFKGASF